MNVIIAKDSTGDAKLLLTRDDGVLTTDTNDDDYYYKAISDDTSGTTGTIWDPTAGKSIHLTGLFISVTAAGTVEIYDNATGTTIAMLVFAAKKGENFVVGGNLVLTADNVLGAKWTTDAGTEIAYITAIGHEH